MDNNALFISIVLFTAAICVLIGVAIFLVKQSEVMSRQNRILEKKLIRMTKFAFHDDLTGIFNRRYLEKIVEKENARVKHENNNQSIQTIFFDLDGFKFINDTYGHGAGDETLIDVARFVSSILRPHDIFARYGGDEFVILFQEKNIEFAKRKAEEIITLIEAIDTGYLNAKLSASIGVSESKKDNILDNPIKAADAAMYVAKKAGKGCVRVYNKSMS